MPTPRVAGGPGQREKECSSHFGALPTYWAVPSGFQIPAVTTVISYYYQREARDIRRDDTQTRNGTNTGHRPKKAQTHSELQ